MIAAPRRLHYGWIVAAVTFITLLSAAGFRSTPGILIVPLHNEFGWSTATISLAVSVNLILYGLSGPFVAALIVRFGVRRSVTAALCVISAGAFCTIFMHQPWELIALWGVVVGVGTGAIAPSLSATIATRWFVEKRGLVMGLLTAAGATGQLIFLPLLASLAVNHGWRFVSMTIAGAALASVPLVVLFMRSFPKDVGLRAYGATQNDPEVTSNGNPLAAAFTGLAMGLRSRNFLYLAGSFFICGLTTNGLIGTHLIPASVDHGMSEVVAASLLGTIGVFDIIGTTISGWLTDKFDSRWLLFWYYFLRGLSLLFLPYAFGSPFASMIAFIVFYGLDWVATVPPTVALSADTFGKQNVGIVFGWIFATHQIGAAFAAYGAGAVRTIFGDYQIAFMVAGAFSIVAAGLVLRISKGKPHVIPPMPVNAVAGAAPAS